MTKQQWLACALGALLFSTGASAYTPVVHSRLTNAALNQAAFGVDFQKTLGVDLVHVAGGQTPILWAQQGSIREDDIHESFPPARSLHHFFDPVHGASLTVGAWPLCTTSLAGYPTIRADEWALAPTFNDWGLPRARSYHKQALLGPNPGVRDQNIGFFFRALGHMVHLLQDMAQPEHTRNDQHMPLPGIVSDLYERWAHDHIGLAPEGEAAQYFMGYETVILPTFAAYFHGEQGRGMADYANRSFVTQNTNYHDKLLSKCFKYDFPAIEDAESRVELITERPLDDNGIPSSQEVVETIYSSTPVDLYLGTTDRDAYHTLYSVFDAETQKYDPTKHVFALNDSSYAVRAAILLPRATGYTAGFIHHYFSGSVSATWKRLTSGPYAYELKLTNTSSVAIGADARLSVLYRADPSYFNRTNSDDTAVIFMNETLSSLAPGFAGLPPGESVTVHVPPVFGLKSEDSITEYERRILIEGQLGSEKDSIISLVQPAVDSSRFVAEAKWDGTSALSLLIEKFADETHNQLLGNNQACFNPATGRGCLGCCGTMENVTILREEAGIVSLEIVPKPGHYYTFSINSSSRAAKQVDLIFKLDGEVLMEGTLVVPGCTQRPPTCFSQLPNVFIYDIPE